VLNSELQFAVEKAYDKVVDMLLSKGADIDSKE